MGEYMELPAAPTAVAPDGSDVRVLLGTARGGLAHFEFAPDQVAPAIRHRTVDEVWYFVKGTGRMWTSGGPDDGVEVGPDSCVSIPVGDSFQVRTGAEPLAAVAVTMPPWPGEDEAEIVAGPWEPTT